MTTALIAEDEPLLAQALKAELARLWPALRIVAEAGDGEQALQQALAHKPDVCFFDIRMPGMDGLEAAQALAEEWPDGTPFPLIVFVTAYDQYALQAFDRAAVDYVLKPVQPERLAQTCARLEAALRTRNGQQVAGGIDAVMEQLRGLIAADAGGRAAAPGARLRVIQAGVGNLIHMVPVDEVLYFEAADKYVRVVTAEREHLVRMSLKELQPQLDPQRFWQIHRGIIVRCDAIASALRDESGKLTLALRGHADKLTVSRMYAHRFRGM